MYISTLFRSRPCYTFSVSALAVFAATGFFSRHSVAEEIDRPAARRGIAGPNACTDEPLWPVHCVFLRDPVGQVPGSWARLEDVPGSGRRATCETRRSENYEFRREPGESTVYVGILSYGAAQGVAGWSLSIAADPSQGMALLDATTAGQVSADVSEGGLRDAGFEKTELVNPTLRFESGPEEGRPQGPGVVSAVVLTFVPPGSVTLESSGVASVLAITVRGGEGDAGRLYQRDHLRGSGISDVRNATTVDGESVRFVAYQGARFEFGVRPEFLRGDANADFVVDISDGIRTLGFLFLGHRPPPCTDAADANDDGEVDMADALTTFGFLFFGSAVPPPPGPLSCGPDPSPDDMECTLSARCDG